MSPLRHSNDLLVGTSILAAVVILTGATLWVKQSDIGERRTRVVARFHDVANASVGNAVVIRGVRAGRIEAIELAPDGWVHVRMMLDPEVRLPRQPAVLLSESSLFGEWQATITERQAVPKDDAVLRALEEAEGAGTVLPGATLPDVAKLTAVAGQIAGDVATVAGRVQVAFDDAAAREVRSSLRNFSDLSATLAQSVRTHAGDLDTLSRGLQSAVASLDRTAATTQRMAERLDGAVSAEETRQIVDDVAQSAASLRRAAVQLDALALRLGASQVRLDHFLAGSDSLVTRINAGQGTLGLLVTDPSLYQRGDTLLVELQRLVTDLRQNPRRYLTVKIF